MTISLDDGLTLQLGEHSYIHDQKIHNPSGALTHVTIGKFCSIATDLTVIGYDHHHEWITTYPFLDDAHRAVWPGTSGIPYPQAPEYGSNKNRGDIAIGNDVWIGCDVKLFKGITIGNGAVIGACSLVNKSVEPYTIVAGTPARPIRKRFTDAEIAALERIRWWDWPPELINQYLPFLCGSKIADLEKYLAADPAIQRLQAGTSDHQAPAPIPDFNQSVQSTNRHRTDAPKPAYIASPAIFNSLGAPACLLSPLPVAAAPVGNCNGHTPAIESNGSRPATTGFPMFSQRPAPRFIPPAAPAGAPEQASASLRDFHDQATDYFADVVPPQLSELHLRNSRVVPTREHILPLMPKSGICAEVGTQTGGFAKLIFSILRPAKLHIYDIDYTLFDHAHFASAIQTGSVELHQGDSSTLLGMQPDRHFDFIYIDGDHSYNGVVKDLEQSAWKIKDDGWIVCNDYTIYSPLEKIKYGICRAVNEFCLNHGFEIVFLGLHPWGYHDVALRKRTA